MLLFELIAEHKIREAAERGDLDNLPGAGAPLDLDDDPLVPQDVRVAHRILRNAGFLPPEVEVRREIRDLERLVAEMGEGTQRSRASRKLQALSLQLAESRGRGVDLRLEQECYLKLIDRLG